MNVMLKKIIPCLYQFEVVNTMELTLFFFFVMICIIKAAIKGADLIQSQIHIFI